MASGSAVALIDFDGTLFFTDKSLEHASVELMGKKLSRRQVRLLPRRTKSRIYELGFSKYRDLSVPNMRMIRLIKTRRGKMGVAVLTARLDGSQRDVRYLLNKNKVPTIKMIFRSRKDSRMHDEEWKLKIVGSLAKKYDRVELFEDKLDNIRHIRSGVDSRNVEFFLVRPNSVKRV
ncbi:MAG: hypothetical protein ACREBW_08325 [Candidatus Micrarchaeaceae archaeon]